MKRLLIAIVLAARILLPTADASVRRDCHVRCRDPPGYSDDYKLEVEFATGKELNKQMRTFNYGPFSNYALLWFDAGEVAILEIDWPLCGVGEEFDHEGFRRLFRLLDETTAIQINLKSRTRWRLKGKGFLRWVDPRVR